ncbi:FUSC family protein [Gluconacetobacter azotocaptans]|uniref:FUSC family protein n=1 Tax=Gluconacetobacter azotocaptans TaxID=142834 RepID=A0A7W4JQZ1_9PROT|nr:FUSC family protein [Gluconacetobacter azotocaptans]MBB2189243.1 FUSC family protein [Gluconacetobacter azotocaptans]GBQ32368.1 fusaric acid resistance protein FusB [Gluconacetobacter azotocaptans DSM 13594]
MRSLALTLARTRVGDLWSRLWSAPPRRQDQLRWLFAPDLLTFGYALRTTITSLVALGIALWWELGSPQWAALTVWMVAQGTRGKSVAKARWHLFGMVVGTICAVALVAALPQSPLLFIVALAVGIGLFCFVGTLLPGPATMTNYRIHGMRASGFTYAIIALDGIADPEHIFQIAMARATYIVLGIVLESSVSALFQFRLGERARDRLTHNFLTAIDGAARSLAALLAGDGQVLSRARSVFATITTLSDQIEFAEVELGRHHGHEGDHARAALARIAVLLSRGLDLAALMHMPGGVPADGFHANAEGVRTFLLDLPARLESGDVRPVLDRLGALRAACRQSIADSLGEEMGSDSRPPASADAAAVLQRQRMLQHGLDAMLDDLEQAIIQFEASLHPLPHDHFHYRIRSFRDWQQALANSLRASVTIFGAGVIWIATGWRDGLTFLMFVSIVCSLFATLEKPALATQAFLTGALWAVGVSGVLVLWVLATPSSYEMLALCLSLPMLAGGLAFAYPTIILAAVSYNLFLPILIGPANQARLDEIAFFNTAMPLILALWYAMWTFRLVLPFDTKGMRWQMRTGILKGLRLLARSRTLPSPLYVIERNVDRFVRLLTNAEQTPEPVVDAYLQGILSAMTIGLNVIRLRAVLARNVLPPQARQVIEEMMGRMAQFSGRYGGHYGRTARAAKLAIQRITSEAGREANLATRMEMDRALSSLNVISYELDTNQMFFDAASPYLDSALG